MPRTVGSIPRSWFSDDRIVRAYYMKMDWFTTGTQRWTTRQTYPATTESRDVGDGNGVQNWDGTHPWRVGNIQEGASGYTISDLTMGNEDHGISDLIYLNGGCEGIPVNVWIAAFDKDTKAFIDARPLFFGEFERAECREEVQFSIVPKLHPMRQKAPNRRLDVAHGYKFAPKDGNKLAWGSDYHTLPAAPPTSTDPPPPPGGPLTGHPRMPVVPVDPTGRTPRDVARPLTRTVTRP